MARKKPCSICRKWFEPHPRAGARQRVCSSMECQRERQRRAVADWRRRNPDYDRENRLRARVVKEEAAEPAPPDSDPMARLDQVAARNAVGLEVMVVLTESTRLIVDWARNAVVSKAKGKPIQPGQVPPVRARNAFDSGRRPP